MTDTTSLRIGDTTVRFDHTAVNFDAHLFIDGDHDPDLCPECIRPGTLVFSDEEPMTDTKVMTVEDVLETLASGWRSWTHDQLDGTSFIEKELEGIEKAKVEALAAINRIRVQDRLDDTQQLLDSVVDSNHFEPKIAETVGGDYITIYRGKCFECHLKQRQSELKNQLHEVSDGDD